MIKMFKARVLVACVTAAVTAVGVGFGAGTAEADTGIACLWAGTSHPYLKTVVAGGWSYECGWDGMSSRWYRGGQVNQASTVPNPGAYTNPSGLFSGGARQPGTSYNDYCVGSQLIDGGEDTFEVVWTQSGSMLWKAAGPINQWRFDAGTGPQRTWRSASLCYDGVLI